MNICPGCSHKEITGALFCSECGTQLVFTERLSTQAIVRPPSEGMFDQAPVPEEEDLPDQQPLKTGSCVLLSLVEIGELIPLEGRAEFTIGRVAEGQLILPDVDLSAYSAYSQGVSRLHAAVKILAGQVMVMDLGSTNGTRVNGQKILPNIEYPLSHGDVVALGKLKVQILLQG